MRTYQMLLIVAAALIATACVDPVTRDVDNLEQFVSKVELESANYNETEWDQINVEFERLCTEVEANYDEMTPEQQEKAMKAVGKYYGTLARQGIHDFTNSAKKIFNSIPSLIQGFGDAFEEE